MDLTKGNNQNTTNSKYIQLQTDGVKKVNDMQKALQVAFPTDCIVLEEEKHRNFKEAHKH